MVGEWWSFAQKGDCLWVTYFKYKSLHNYTRQGSRQSGYKEDNRSSAGEEGYAAICAGRQASERDGPRPIRPTCVSSEVGNG